MDQWELKVFHENIMRHTESFESKLTSVRDSYE